MQHGSEMVLTSSKARWEGGALKVHVHAAQIAQAFAEMDDEEQAQFFIEVAKIASTWDGRTFQQWYSVGRHLATCECSNDEARELVQELAQGVNSQCRVGVAS